MTIDRLEEVYGSDVRLQKHLLMKPRQVYLIKALKIKIKIKKPYQVILLGKSLYPLRFF